MPEEERDDGRIDQIESRESIWGVRPRDRSQFSVLFSVLFLIGMGLALWYEIGYVTDDGLFDTVMAVILKVLPIGGTAVVLTFFRFEGDDTVGVAYDIHKRRERRIGRAEGLAEGRAEAREELRAEFEAKYGAELQALRTRVAAIAPYEDVETADEEDRDELRVELDALWKRVEELEGRRNGGSSNGNGDASKS